MPSLNDPVAWPTIPELGENIVLTSKTTVLTTKTTRVPILNLQLSSKSVAKTGRAEKDELADHYVGLIGENKGDISYITLRDPDIQVNVKTETVAADALPNDKPAQADRDQIRHGAGGGPTRTGAMCVLSAHSAASTPARWKTAP